MNFTPEQLVALIASIGGALVGIAGVIATAVVSVKGQKRSSDDQRANREANAADRLAEREAARELREREWVREQEAERERQRQASLERSRAERRKAFENFAIVVGQERTKFRRGDDDYVVPPGVGEALVVVRMVSKAAGDAAQLVFHQLEIPKSLDHIAMVGGGRSTRNLDASIEEYLEVVRKELAE